MAWAFLMAESIFGAVADDAGVVAEAFAVGVGVCGDGCDVESFERGSVSIAAMQNGAPGETGLCAFENQQLE